MNETIPDNGRYQRDWHVKFTLYCEGMAEGRIFHTTNEEKIAAEQWDEVRYGFPPDDSFPQGCWLTAAAGRS